jgi:cytochrome c-type biogenesis protein CcmH/NrfG
MRNKHKLLPGILVPLLILSSAAIALAQSRGITLDPVSRAPGFIVFGDVEVTGEGADEKPLTFTLILYTRTGIILDRQRVGSKGRYQFNNVAVGDYDVAVEFDNNEVSRTHIKLTGMLTRFRQDISLELRSGAPAVSAKPPTVSAEDAYDRKGPDKSRFEKAEEALDKKEYDKAVALLTQIITDDPQDFQALSELGTVHMIQKNPAEAEKAYVRATEIRPTFFLALLNLGRLRLRQKSFDGAIDALSQAVTVQPTSPEANYLLGDAYLQIKRGSKAVGYLNEALKLDPAGKADAHLLLAALYNGAGMKDKAAAEYEEFLKKKPDYADRKKLEAYIAANKDK